MNNTPIIEMYYDPQHQRHVIRHGDGETVYIEDHEVIEGPGPLRDALPFIELKRRYQGQMNLRLEEQQRNQSRALCELFGVDLGSPPDVLRTMESGMVPIGDASTVTYDSAGNPVEEL